MPAPVVFDINVLVNAAAGAESDFLTWPVLPPKTDNPAADCIGIANDHHEFTLWLSPHILDNTRRVLTEIGWSSETADRYIEVLEEICIGSGGEIVTPARTVHDCSDYEDNLILDLAAHSGAVLIVSDDTDLSSMSPWRATPVLRPREFASRVDVSRRAQRTLSAPSTTQRLRERTARRVARAGYDLDSPMSGHDPYAYQELREQFDQDYARLAEIVADWTPTGPRTTERIKLWKGHLETFTTRISELDELAEGRPELAQDALEKLSERIDFALSRLDPQRQQPKPKKVDRSIEVLAADGPEQDRTYDEPQF